MMWSKLKKQLEDFICPSLKGRVEFWITNYRKAPDQLGRAYITVDGKEVINMCTYKKEVGIYRTEQEIKERDNIDFNEYDYEQDEMSELLRKIGYSEEMISQIAINRAINDIAEKKVEEKGIFAQYDFFEAVKAFLNSPIEESLKSDNPIIKSLAVIDKRIGKRTLSKLKEPMKDEKSELVRYFYKLRCEAENI